MSKPTVAILAGYVSSNMLGRAYVLWELLREDFDAFLVGPEYGLGVWEPLASADLPLRIIEATHLSNPVKLLRLISQAAKADLVIASKPFATSFGAGLVARQRFGSPLILDMDDADLPRLPPSVFEWAKSVRDIRRHHWWWSMAALQPLIRTADARTAASRALERFYKADEYIPHSRDAALFRPEEWPLEEAKAALGLAGKRVVMFLGTPREHKGLAELAQAVGALPDEEVRLVYIATTKDAAFLTRVEDLTRGRGVALAPFPFAELPSHLAAADIVAIPQQPGAFAAAQLPAKVFDAMAMAKPVLATQVGDLPEVLEGCGLLAKTPTAEGLSAGLAELLSDEKLRIRLGQAGREKFLSTYSLEAVRPRFVALARRLLG